MVGLGSWYDQVVPLYSALLVGFHHPSIYRAIYIDKADYSPDFLTELILFGIKLRNAGLSDNNLIVHLTDVLAGNLFTGTPGHTVVYQAKETYNLAIEWAMVCTLLFLFIS